MKLQQDSFTPLYQQIKEEMRAAIENGSLKHGDKIPAEPELSEQYNVSRITVRKAISDLVSEGYLIKKQGKGTFVSKPKIQRKIEHLLSFSEACHANGMKASSIIIKREVIPPTENQRELLRLEDDDQVLYIQRVRSANGDPIMLENNYYPYNKFKFLCDENLDGSLYELLSKKYGITPNGSSGSSLEIVRANGEISRLLNVPQGEPLFYMKTCVYDTEMQPIHIGRQYMIGEQYKFYLAD